MEEITSYLQQLDLSEVEAKLYLTLLKTGVISVKKIAPMVGLKRTTAYLYVDPLIEKGLIRRVIKGTKKQIVAESPESLEVLVENKIRQAKSQAQTAEIVKKELPQILHAINNVFPQNIEAEEAEIKYYKGRLGVKKIYEQALQANELRSYVNIEEIAGIFPENFELFDDAFKKKQELRMFEITEDSSEARRRIGNSNKRHLYKFLPESMKLKPQDVLLYDGKVAIINLTDKMSGVVLHNDDLFSNFILLFDFLWNMFPNENS